MSDNEQQPPAPPAEAISISFRDQHNNEVTFKLKGTTKLGKAFDAFSARVERDPTQLRFIFDGHKLTPDDTVDGVGIENGDTVDVHMEQIGGSFPVTEDVDQEWVLVSSEDDEASAKRLREENAALKDRLGSLERSAPRNMTTYTTTTASILDANRRGGKIQLHFYDHRNAKVIIKMSNTSRLSKAFEAYADRVFVPAERIGFSWNDYSLGGGSTPFDLGMKHGDRIDCAYEVL